MIAREGVIGKDLSYKLASGIMAVTSVQEIVAPQSVYDIYKLGTPTPLGDGMFKLFAWNKLATAGFLVAAKATGKRALGLATCSGIGALNAVRYALQDASSQGVKKAGPLAWAVVQGALAFLAYKNGEDEGGPAPAD